MNKQPVFAVCQLSRREPFSVSTYLYDDGRERRFVKAPNSPGSKKHLANMLATHKKLLALPGFVEKITPATPKLLADGSVQFPFIEGKGAERMLINAILDQKNDTALSIISRLMTIMGSLPSQQCNPTTNKAFVETFGDAFNKQTDCVVPGLIDLNLDNIIEEKTGAWHLIDYEWSFDFPVPKIYIQQHLFYWLFVVRYQSMLRYHAARIPQKLIAEDISVPTFIHDAYSWVFEDLDKTVATESKFQEYVLGNKSSLPPIKFFDPGVPRGIVYVDPAHGYLEDSEKQLASVTEALRVAKHEQDRAMAELSAIYASKTYRAAHKLSSAKGKITKTFKRKPKKKR